MNVSQLLKILEELVEDTNPRFRSIVDRLLANKPRRQEITFLGAYSQELDVGMSLVPFIFFQTQMQAIAWRQGKLQATGYDMDFFSIGGIRTSQNALIFEKHYRNKEINPHRIDYSGQLLENGSYEGIWSFNPLLPPQESDAGTGGPFRLKFLSPFSHLARIK